MPAYTIREWEKLVYGVGEGRIPDSHASRLAALAERSPFAGRGGGGVLEHGRHALRARGVIGILSTGDLSLEILPKIDVDSGETVDQQNATVRKRLVHMLAVALDLKLDLGAITDLAWQRETLLEILIRIFCTKLTEALRKGMPRRYINRDEDLPVLRGQLDITRQFMRHAADHSRLACRFDLLSNDTPLNRIMKAAVVRLARVSRRPTNQQHLRELAFVYAEIAEEPVSALRWDQVVIDRTNRAWQDLYSMARLFLQNRYQTTTSGNGEGTTMMFEMNSLFEEFVGRSLVRALAGTGLSVSLQGGRLFCLNAQDNGRALFQTKPDILIRQGSTVTHVIDTKWKRISARIDDPKQGVSQADVYQMMAYAQLYNAPRMTLLYPHHPGLGHEAAVHARYSITGHATTLETASVDISNNSGILAKLRALVVERSDR